MHCRSKIVPSFCVLLPFELDQILNQDRVENAELITLKAEIHDLGFLFDQLALVVELVVEGAD